MKSNVILPTAGTELMDRFVILKLISGDTAGTLAVVEHELNPGMLGAPMHTHRNEDEYSYVLEGEMTALIGEELVRAPVGSLVCKPRDIPHTFWNSGATRLRLLELIVPGGFEGYFVELAEIVAVGSPPDVGRIIALAEKYGVEMDFSSLAMLSQTYNVGIGGDSL